MDPLTLEWIGWWALVLGITFLILGALAALFSESDGLAYGLIAGVVIVLLAWFGLPLLAS